MTLEASEESMGVDEIVAAVRSLRAATGRLPSERILAGQLNVKRHQLRKALVILREAGDLFPAAARRGPAELPRHSEELVRLTNPIEVLEMRLLMEPGLARLASLRASGHEIARIMATATTPEDAEAGPVDLAFHIAIVAAARNHLAGEFYKMLRQVGVDARVRIARINPTPCPKRIRQRDAEHRLIAEAIADRNPEAAEAAMRAHLLAVQKLVNARGNAGAEAA